MRTYYFYKNIFGDTGFTKKQAKRFVKNYMEHPESWKHTAYLVQKGTCSFFFRKKAKDIYRWYTMDRSYYLSAAHFYSTLWETMPRLVRKSVICHYKQHFLEELFPLYKDELGQFKATKGAN